MAPGQRVADARPGPAEATVESTVRSMWSRILAIADIGMDDDWFALGGDSVAASDLLGLVQDAFEVDLDLDKFLGASTVAGLSAAIRRRGQAAEDNPVDQDQSPVAFSQEGMLWYEHFAPGSFNMAPFVRRYHGHLDVDALRASLSDLVRRHAPLRTTFELARGRPRQRVQPASDLHLPVADLTSLDADARHLEVRRRVVEAASRPFRLAEECLFQPTLLRLGNDDHVLIIRLHHLTFDDWAVDVFRRDLSALYRAHHSGVPADLPPLQASFGDFCRRQRRRLAGVAGTDELDFWRRELAGAPWTTQLPIDDPSKPRGSPHRAVGPITYALPPALVEALRTWARQHRTTLYMALLAVFAVVVRESTHQDDMVLATVVANRNRPELEPLIGCFTKKVVIRLDLGGDPTFVGVAERVRDALLRALAHQDLPFETVVQQALGPPAARHGLVPDVSTMFQAEAPRREKLVLPGLTITGYDIGPPIGQAHFASSTETGGDTPKVPKTLWGGGIYSAAFLILSVLDTGDGVSLVARGAFHPPAVDHLVARFEETLARVLSDPDQRLSQLVAIPEPSSGVNLGGFVIDPSRLEAALGSAEGVRDVAVVVRKDDGGHRMLAYVVVDEDARSAVTLRRLRSHLWRQLPGYAWPAELVVVPALPLGDDRPVSEPDGGGGGIVDSEEPIERERELMRLWRDLLGGGHVHGDANYWQRFSFLDVLTQADRSGIPITTEQVRRNRTVRALATDLSLGHE